MGKPFVFIHLRKISIGLALVSVIGLWLFFGPAKMALKSWRASALVEEAKEFAEAGEWNDAQRLAMASFQNEESLEALRLVVIAAVKTGDPESLNWAYTLFRFSGATPEDKSWVLSFALDMQDKFSMPGLISRLTPEEARYPAIHFQLVRAHLIRKEYQEAVTLADDPSVTSRDPAVDFILARGLAFSGLRDAGEATNARLLTLLNLEDRELALEAVRFMGFLKDECVSQALAQAALDRFQDDPDLSAGAKLNLELFRIEHKEEGPLDEVIAQAIADYRESDLPVLVQWLARLEQSQKVVELTEVSEGQKRSKEVFFLRLQALQNLEKWEQVETELADPGIAIPEPLLFAGQAVAANRLGNESQSNKLWQRAIEAAKRDRKRNWFSGLTEKSRQLGDPDRVMETVIAGINHPGGVLPDSKVLAALFQWLKDKKDGKRFLEATMIVFRREPENSLVLNNFSYLIEANGQLENNEIDEMQGLVSRYPEQESFRNALAFVFLLMRDAKACLEVLDKASPSPGEFSHLGKAIYANALVYLKRKDEAIELAKSIDWNEIPAKERRKLKSLFP